MNNAIHTPLIFIALVWATYFVQLYRTYRAGRLKTDFSRFLWLAAFLAVIVITFSGRDAEQQLDGLVAELPISFYAKFVCALIIIHALYLMVRPTMALDGWKDRLCRYGTWITMGLGLLTIPLYMSLPTLPREQLRYGLIALRDVVVCFYMVGMFIPATYRLWRTEKILPTKLKHFAGVLFDLAYLVLALGNLLTFFASLNSLELAAGIDLAFKPVMTLCALYFTICITPNRLLNQMYWPQRWLLLRRLYRLETTIRQRANAPIRKPMGKGIEDRIYRTVISILDQYRKLQHRTDTTLYQRIETTVRTHSAYRQLVENLAKLA